MKVRLSILSFSRRRKTYSNTVRFLTSLEGDDAISYVTVTGQGGNSIRDDDGDGFSVEDGDCDDDNPPCIQVQMKPAMDSTTIVMGSRHLKRMTATMMDGVFVAGDCDDTNRFVYPGQQSDAMDLTMTATESRKMLSTSMEMDKPSAKETVMIRKQLSCMVGLKSVISSTMTAMA